MATIQLAGGIYTPSSLAGVFTADSQAMDDADAAHAAAAQKVKDEQTAHAKTKVVLTALKGYLLSFFGTQAVAVLGDFGMTAPKAKGSKTVATKAVAVAKSKATRAARGTKGKVAKLATKGTVDAAAITAAINTPTAAPTAEHSATAPATSAPAPSATPAPAAGATTTVATKPA